MIFFSDEGVSRTIQIKNSDYIKREVRKANMWVPQFRTGI